VTYVTARLSLLVDALALDDHELAPTIAGLRRALELDRYGIAAHVLVNRDGCNVEACPAFAWVEDPTALKANLKARAFDGYVQRYETAWKNEGEAKAPAVANAAPPASDPVAADASPGHSPVSSRYDFPSAASIPPVSIMNKEPPRPPEGVAAAPSDTPGTQVAPEPALPVPPRRPQTQGAAPR
jgi:hypothetical protein